MNVRHLIILLCSIFTTFSVNAASSQQWKTFSDIGAYGLIGTALAIPAYKSDWEGFEQANYSILSALTTGVITKSLVDKERPDKSDDNSFFSNHTASAFSAATTLNIRYGWQTGLPAYGLATLVGIGRVQADKHYWSDVLTGAAIGSLSAWIFTGSLNENVQITPWGGNKKAGVSISVNW
ncbi:phosphatase PAP2 family protein [Psychromonas sp. RZ22]|uniref:phosphatase PAP2 family protein n=1 Tax=Psychromonas algarum TaxID=2555643 RepID=UPI0010673D55|nr:phosphatase PAP2 family protein [Psychromonas sp. RZ22]TEW54694.1 phosphatase PAP2 family protein [Psychromonas sp. RZ22]